MSAIQWLVCPKCSYRFYIIEEQAGRGHVWFCPACKHEFRESEQKGSSASRVPSIASM